MKKPEGHRSAFRHGGDRFWMAESRATPRVKSRREALPQSGGGL
jgi:hypothetical protein